MKPFLVVLLVFVCGFLGWRFLLPRSASKGLLESRCLSHIDRLNDAWNTYQLSHPGKHPADLHEFVKLGLLAETDLYSAQVETSFMDWLLGYEEEHYVVGPPYEYYPDQYDAPVCMDPIGVHRKGRHVIVFGRTYSFCYEDDLAKLLAAHAKKKPQP